MIKYNGTTNIITTDDITVSGDNIGKTITDVLDEQSQKLKTLSSNVKWLAKYGGVGGSGGGGTNKATKLKFDGEIFYTDLNGNDGYKSFTLLDTNLFFLQTQVDTPVVINIQIKSTFTLPVYSATLSCGSDLSYGSDFNTTTRKVSFTIIPHRTVEQCNLTVFGELTITIPFNCYTKIVEDSICIKSGKYITLYDAGMAYISYKETNGLHLNVKIDNQIPDSFDVLFKSLKINGNVVDISSLEDKINFSFDVSNYFIDTLLGLYNISYVYTILNKASGLGEDRELKMLLLYKNSDTRFVLCSSGSSDLTVSENATGTPIACNDRTLCLKYKIYGSLLDDPDTKYSVEVNNVTVNSNASVDTEYKCYLDNNSENESGEWKSIVFNVNGYFQTYYYYIKQPSEITYIYLNEEGTMYYKAIGDNTESNRQYLNFPSKGVKLYWNFSSNTTISMIAIPNKFILPKSSIADFVKNEEEEEGLVYFDGLFNIGINYLDISYSQPIITLNSNNSEIPTKIILYRDKITYEEKTLDKFAIPNDGKFHLISIYLKKCYHEDLDISEINYNNLYFAVYIDGVLETNPIELSEFSLSKTTNIQLLAGDTEFNHFGMYYFNPRPASIDRFNKYSNVVKKYLTDFDPVIVSNYSMVYNNNHTLDTQKEMYPDKSFISVDMYDNLISTDLKSNANWINYYNPDAEHVIYKFLKMDLNTLAKLIGNADLPIYRIKLEENLGENGLHNFVSNTMSSEDESGNKYPTNCTLQKAILGGDGKYKWQSVFNETYLYMTNGGINTPIKAEFTVRYLGSSTLLYSVKNFELSLNEQTVNNTEYELYYNPNPNLWSFPEKAFNLKADIVDSSSCTNNVIANFVNKYMESPFSTSDLKYSACLSGFPILLFIENNTGVNENEDLFLGIYNFNLGRSSLNNLGYLKLPNNWENGSKYDGNVDDGSYIYLRNTTLDRTSYKEFYVAEISGNSGAYDFTQYDSGLLKKMYGDYFSAYGNPILLHEDTYFSKLEDISEDFAAYCYEKIVKDCFNLYNYNYNDLVSYRDTIAPLQKNLRLCYINEGLICDIPDAWKIVTADDIDKNNLPYRTIDSNGISLVGNPLYLFIPVVDEEGFSVNVQTISKSFYAIKPLTSFIYNPNVHVNTFDKIETLKYYIICMAFAMVDSVQKNLTVKNVGGNIWYPEFYDMDTALGLDNAGGCANYQAFSDYVDSSGTIVLDYVGDAKGWFDTPSSYLFLFAKYDSIINGESDEQTTPFHYWCALRGVKSTYEKYKGYNELRNAKYFCENYLYKHLPNNIPPIIWNLNYAYKYFSKSENTEEDTEKKRFNGTMIFRRADWLENRLHFLDAMFGIANERNIGRSNKYKISKFTKDSNNSDVVICSLMFELFTKGVTPGQITANVTDKARTPIVIQTSSDSYFLKLVNDSGLLNVNFQQHENADLGFFGTRNLQTVSECGLFLLSTNAVNTIKNNQIETIVITDERTKSFLLNKSDLPSLKTINIGNSSGNLLRTVNAITITASLKSLLENININKLSLVSLDNKDKENLTISHLNIEHLNIQLFSCNTLTFLNCTFNNNISLTSSISVDTLIIESCTFKGDFTFESSATKKIIIKNSKFGIDDDENIKQGKFELRCNSLELLNINNLSGYEFINKYITKLLYSDETNTSTLKFTDLKIKKLRLNSEGESNYSSETNINIDTTTTKRINTISLQYLSNCGDVYISLPGFASVKNFNIGFSENNVVKYTSYNNKVNLCNSGIAWMKIKKLPYNIVLDSNATGCFYRCDLLNSTNWCNLLNIFENVTNCTDLFYSNGTNITFNNLINILKALQSILNNNSTRTIDCTRMFYATKFSTTFTIKECAELGVLLESIRTKISSYTGMFYLSGVTFFTKEFENFTNLEYFMSECFVETGAMRKIKTIKSNYMLNYPSLKFINVYRDLSNTATYKYGEIQDHDPDNTVITGTYINEIKISTEFPNCANLCTNIYTRLNTLTESELNDEIYFDFSGLIYNFNVSYGGIFGYGTNLFPNFRNFNSYVKNNYNKLSFTSIDFNCQEVLSIEDLAEDKRFVGNSLQEKIEKYGIDYYDLLVDNNGNLRTKLLNLIPFNLDSWNYRFWHLFKYITKNNFFNLLKKLVSRTNIGTVFSNCVVLEVNTDYEQGFFEEQKTVSLTPKNVDPTNGKGITYYSDYECTTLFKWNDFFSTKLAEAGFGNGVNTRTYTYGLLNKFSNVSLTFEGFSLYTSLENDRIHVPLNLNNAFLSEGSLVEENKTLTLYYKIDYDSNDDTQKTVLLTFRYSLPKYTEPYPSKVTTLLRTFKNSYLVPLNLTGNVSLDLKIKSGSVTSLAGAFYNCEYAYNLSYNFESIYKGSFENIRQPQEPWALLPLNFFNILATDANIENAFTNINRTFTYRLLGIIPTDSTYWGTKEITFNNAFVNTLIYWNKYEDDKYAIFPEWYIKSSGINKFKVLIPFPLINSSSSCYLFYFTSKTLPKIPTYGKLPSLLPSHGGKYYYSELKLDQTTEPTETCPKIIPNNLNRYLPSSSDANYLEIITVYLLFLLYSEGTVIYELKTMSGYLNESYSKQELIDRRHYFYNEFESLDVKQYIQL